MKLHTKLFLCFSGLFFVVINFLGLFFIRTIYLNEKDSAYESTMSEFDAILYNLKITEQYYYETNETEEQGLIEQCEQYIQINGDRKRYIILWDANKKAFYSSREFKTIPSDIFETEDFSIYRREITQNKNHYLLLSQKYEMNEHTYYVTFIKNIETIYTDTYDNFYRLLLYFLLTEILMIIIIYYLAKSLTKPLQTMIQHLSSENNNHITKLLDTNTKFQEYNLLALTYNQMEKKIVGQMGMLQNQSDQKQRFIDSLTHEIRTPLTSIIGYSSLLLRQNEDDATRKSLECIHQNGQYIKGLTEQLVKLIAIDKMEAKIQTVELLEIVNQIKMTFANRLDEENVELLIKGDNRTIDTDAELLIILLSNFVDNAIKAVGKSNIKCITLVIDEQFIIIQDTGIGIPKEDLDKIIEPFYMVDKSRNKSINGFGLGLALCKNIVDFLHLEFKIESIVGEGTTIKLKI